MNYRLAYLQQAKAYDLAQVIQHYLKKDSSNPHQAALLQAALEAHLRKNQLNHNHKETKL